MRIDYGNVTVQLMYSSPRARNYYRLARQRKPIGTISLLGVDSMDMLLAVWKETIGKSGMFSLLAHDSRGRLARCVGIVTVDRGRIEIKDRRCGLFKRMEMLRKRRQVARQDDFVIEGGTGGSH